MNAKDLGDLPAYPDPHEDSAGAAGLSKREAFAMVAMQGMAMRVTSLLDHEVAYSAVRLADALLLELAKDQP